MSRHLALLSVPGLRAQDLERMPTLTRLTSAGGRTRLAASFPAVTWPVQAAMLTGKTPSEHGVVANGFYWRDREEVEMWTAWNQVITAPQIWDLLRAHDSCLTSAVWFPMLSKGSSADYVCMPAPIHNPDGSESLWCYTTPTELYGDLRDSLGHFPLQHFWGPLANLKSTAWIVDSAVLAARRYRPNFFYIYLPHLDYAAQKSGPDSEAALQAVNDLDATLARLVAGFTEAYGDADLAWLVASEYTIVPVNHVSFPNRVLREAGLLRVQETEQGEQLDLRASDAWALVDHQLAHVFVRQEDAAVTARVAELFRQQAGLAEVLTGNERARYGLDTPRAGDVILISEPESWQAYYWWLDDARAPSFARTVDIHAKPGYDPVELHFDPVRKGIPLDATLIRGSHGAPVVREDQAGVLLSSHPELAPQQPVVDREVCATVLRYFGAPTG